MSQSGFLYNDLWMIESLKPGERKTGTNLYNDVWENYSCDSDKLTSNFVRVDDKKIFFQTIERILNLTQLYKRYPLIHIECHGDENGITLSSNELITWKELTPYVVKINKACGVNLCFVLAACYGLEAMWITGHAGFEYAPYYALIGPNIKIYPEELESAYHAFYRELLSNGDLTLALSKCNNQLSENCIIKIFDVENLYRFAFSQSVYRGREKREHSENLVSQLMQNPVTASKGVKWVRKEVKRRLSKEEFETEIFDKIKFRYFGINDHPENKSRFRHITYEKVHDD